MFFKNVNVNDAIDDGREFQIFIADTSSNSTKGML